jgi:hypothetical protein
MQVYGFGFTTELGKQCEAEKFKQILERNINMFQKTVNAPCVNYYIP